MAASEVAAVKADARREKVLKLVAEEVANARRPERTKALDSGISRWLAGARFFRKSHEAPHG
jgi:hypothetical protein